jgi:hypothetical protein
MKVATGIEALRATIDRAYDELAEDAERYLELLGKLRQTSPGHEDYLDLEVAVEVQVGVMQAHTASLGELLDKLNDALAEQG